MKIRNLLRRHRVTVVVGTVNVGRGVTPARAAAAFRLILTTILTVVTRLGRRKIAAGMSIGFQEIDEADQPDEHGILHGLAQRLAPGLRWAGWATAVPFTIPRGWSATVWTRVLAHGVAKVSPTRPAIVGRLRHRWTGIEIYRVNWHTPHVPHDNRYAARGRALADTAVDASKELIRTLCSFGLPIIITRDPNGRTERIAPHGAKEERYGTDLDEIVVIIPAGCVYDVHVGAHRITANPDVDGHHLEARTVTITKKGA